MTSHLTTGSVGGIKPLSLVSVPNHGGVLTGIGVAGGPGYHYFQVTIDGTVLGANNYLSGILSGPAHGNNGMGVDLPFEKSLDVTVHNAKAFPQTRFWVAYVTDGSEPVSDTRSIKTVDGIEYDYSERRYEASPDTEPYVVVSLVGPRRWSRIELGQDVLFPGEDLTGRLELVDGGDPSPSASAVSLALQLPGTTRRMLSRALGEVQVSDQFTWPSSDLESGLSGVLKIPSSARPRPFELQIAAEITGFVNYPTGFSLI